MNECKLLTKSNEAPFLSYKITIDSKDFERATQDASLWPYGVGVRLFKNFDHDTSMGSWNQRQDNNQRNQGREHGNMYNNRY